MLNKAHTVTTLNLQAKLRYWMKFIASGLSLTQRKKFKVILVGTHVDQITDSQTGKDPILKIGDDSLWISNTPQPTRGKFCDPQTITTNFSFNFAILTPPVQTFRYIMLVHKIFLA